MLRSSSSWPPGAGLHRSSSCGTYGVSHVESNGDHGGRPHSGLLVDELLPHSDGVSHELEFTGGTITVVAHDLTAGWRGKAGPESPRDPHDEANELEDHTD